MTILYALLVLLVAVLVTTITVDDSGVGQRQLNGTASKTILKWSEYHEIHKVFSWAKVI